MAKGFSQVEGIDYDKIFSPVIHYKTIRMMFVLSTLEGMYMTGVKAAFLDETIYIKQPEAMYAIPTTHPCDGLFSTLSRKPLQA